MQRNAHNAADITVHSNKKIDKIQYISKGIPFEIRAEHINGDEYKIKDIPVGGPYTLDINGEIFSDVYVGDVWILAGQSNMQGVGRLRTCDVNPEADENVRAFYMDDKWRPAKHPLHNAWIENGGIHTEEISDPLPDGKYQGVGLGLAFAKQMQVKTGVPQGLICSAYGGSNLRMWLPSEKSLYSAMHKRFYMNGSRVSGMLWFQGCADAFECESDSFEERTIEFFKGVRNDFGFFPIIQFQIGRVVHPELPGLKENWMKIREIQGNLHKKVNGLYTVSSINKSLDDLIHLGSDSSDELGFDAANIMLKLKENRAFMQEIEDIRLCEDEKSKKAVVKVTFKNLCGGLRSQGRPSGFTVCEKPFSPENNVVFNTLLVDNTAIIYLWCTVDEAVGKYLCYGSGLDPYCNLTDSDNNAVLCFGPIKIKE